MRWPRTLTWRPADPGIPTVDVYVLGAVGDLVRARGETDRARPIERLGPHTFAHGERLVIVRYATEPELALIAARRWSHVYYVIDDMLPVAAACAELPQAYRDKLGRFAADVLPRILALSPTILAPSPAILALFPDRPCELIAPCALTIATDLAHFAVAPGEREPLRLAFLGTRSHGAAIGFLIPVFADLKRLGVPFQCTMFFGPHAPPGLTRMAEIDNRPALGWPAFRRFLACERFHLLLAPLPDTPFNAGRSITKVLDAAAVGACGLYSDRAPFAGAVTHGHDGLLLPDDAEVWSAEIARLASDLSAAYRLAARGADLARHLGNPAHLSQFWRDRLAIAHA